MRAEAALISGTGLLFIGLAVPLIRGWVPPNHWYGFRLARDVFQPDIWYPLNAYGGHLLLWWGAAIVAAALGLAVAPVGDDAEARGALYFGVVMGVMLGGVLLITVLSHRELTRLRRERGR